MKLSRPAFNIVLSGPYNSAWICPHTRLALFLASPGSSRGQNPGGQVSTKHLSGRGRDKSRLWPSPPCRPPLLPQPRTHPHGTICSSPNMPRPPMLPAFALTTSSAWNDLLHPTPESLLPGKLLPILQDSAQPSSSNTPCQAALPLRSQMPTQSNRSCAAQ